MHISSSVKPDKEETLAYQIHFFCSDFFQKEHEDDIINKLGEEENYKLWIGKDYTNFIFKDFVDLDQPFSGE